MPAVFVPRPLLSNRRRPSADPVIQQRGSFRMIAGADIAVGCRLQLDADGRAVPRIDGAEIGVAAEAARAGDTFVIG